MNSVQLIIIAILAFFPSFVLFGPLLIMFLLERRKNKSLIALSALRDYPETKRQFLVWVNVYIISQLVYTILALPFLIHVPFVIYVFNGISLILSSISFVFLSSSLKHMFLIGSGFMFSVFSLVVSAILLFQTDTLLGVVTVFTASVIFLSIFATPFKKIPIWHAEYLALAAVSMWNLALFLKLYLV